MAMEGYAAFLKAAGLETKASDCLVSYLGPSLGESYLTVEMQSVYFTAPTDWAEKERERERECGGGEEA